MNRELRYGANVDALLYDLSQHESDDIGEFDFYGEDENGREGCASIDITQLAHDALETIRTLRDQLEAAEGLAEFHGQQNLETKKKLDVLGHESGMMAGLLNDICRYHEECTHNDQMHALIPLEYVSAINDFVARDVDGNNPCPLIDAYLNSVRADTLTRIINTGEFSNWVNQGLQVWVNRFNANSDTQLRSGKDGES